MHRLFQRYGISRLSSETGPQGPAKKKLKDYSIGYFHVDFAQVRTEGGQQYLFVASDCISKLAFAELHPEATALRAADFWRRVITALPYCVTIV